MLDEIEMGRYALGCVRSLRGFGSGRIIALRQIVGTVPVAQDRLNRPSSNSLP